MSEAKDKYRERKSIVEHPFGTMKRQWGFDHIMTEKYIIRATADVGFVFSCYNLRRLISILGITTLIESFNEGKGISPKILLVYHLILSFLRPRNYLSSKCYQKPTRNYLFLFGANSLLMA